METALLVILAVLVTVALYWAFSTAQRLNRLHIRTDSAKLALQAALDKRAAVVAAVEPSSQAAAEAAEAITLDYATFESRANAEREISKAIAAMGEDLPPRVIDAQSRLQLAHRFYNDAVSDTRALRTRPMVRVLRLGGTARLPEYFEFNDF
ncbi:LemA family protein [Corynebacterium vitaeruminis]|uniref:Secreted protein n=1 Tax=Corynebacterium vitaeruminis DSM 20294 TaxID=1224164 RepID=W5Y173_9CORY|nr:hypothetical protein [Corynebacterium vitaeruminis]AHI22942.1 hypothetical protein B843_07785 [Corynebacterium vitaeruminis DSM 20294]